MFRAACDAGHGMVELEWIVPDKRHEAYSVPHRIAVYMDLVDNLT